MTEAQGIELLEAVAALNERVEALGMLGARLCFYLMIGVFIWAAHLYVSAAARRR